MKEKRGLKESEIERQTGRKAWGKVEQGEKRRRSIKTTNLNNLYGRLNVLITISPSLVRTSNRYALGCKQCLKQQLV